MKEPTTVVVEPTVDEFRPGPDQGFPTNWKEALATLISTRSKILKLELGNAAGAGIQKIVFLIIAVLALFFAWIFLMLGAIGLLTLIPVFVWWHSALIIGGLHVLAAVILLLLVKNGSMPGFPLTRAEFEKDREWLNQTKTNTNSPS